MNAFLELSEHLPAENLEELLILPIYRRKVLLGSDDLLLRTRPEANESLENCVTRALYTQTGAVVKQARMLGMLRQDRRAIPVYIAVLYHVERPPIPPLDLKFLDFNTAYSNLRQTPLRTCARFLLNTAFALYHRLVLEDRRVALGRGTYNRPR